MNLGLGLVPARPARHAARLTAATAMLAMAAATMSFAQAQQQPKQAPAKQAPKQQPKQQPPQPAQAPQQQPQQPQQAQQTPQQLPVIYSPWTKFCGKDQNNPQAKQVCLTVKEARLETGQFLAGAALIEQDGEQKKLFRITLPLGMQLPQGTRVIVDQEQPLQARYVVCLPNGCMSDYEVDGAFVGKLKKGQQVTLQGINLPGQAASYPLPLGAEFAKANEGPPTDPKEFEASQKKLQEELQRRAEEARKKLQERQGAAPGAQPKQ
ncbi:MAG: invasion associated locus B family protein [Xanthobacteraceae bacterium]|nr:invasion associated locus B family protein [Xanthobacteraceae bacterium]